MPFGFSQTGVGGGDLSCGTSSIIPTAVVTGWETIRPDGRETNGSKGCCLINLFTPN